MARTCIHIGKIWLEGNNSINIQSRIRVLVHCTSHCLLSINQVSLQSQTSIQYEKWLSGEDNSIKIQVTIMVLVHCPSAHCHLSINQVSLQSQTSIQYEKWLSGEDNSIQIQVTLTVLVHFPSAHCHLSINQVWIQLNPIKLINRGCFICLSKVQDFVLGLPTTRGCYFKGI